MTTTELDWVQLPSQAGQGRRVHEGHHQLLDQICLCSRKGAGTFLPVLKKKKEEIQTSNSLCYVLQNKFNIIPIWIPHSQRNNNMTFWCILIYLIPSFFLAIFLAISLPFPLVSRSGLPPWCPELVSNWSPPLVSRTGLLHCSSALVSRIVLCTGLPHWSPALFCSINVLAGLRTRVSC